MSGAQRTRRPSTAIQFRATSAAFVRRGGVGFGSGGSPRMDSKECHNRVHAPPPNLQAEQHRRGTLVCFEMITLSPLIAYQREYIMRQGKSLGINSFASLLNVKCAKTHPLLVILKVNRK